VGVAAEETADLDAGSAGASRSADDLKDVAVDELAFRVDRQTRAGIAASHDEIAGAGALAAGEADMRAPDTRP
jgi:hypothetical protein